VVIHIVNDGAKASCVEDITHRQSAGAPDGENVTHGTRVSPARRRPYPSSTLTTAVSVRSATTMPRGRLGVGITHHFALAVADDETQLKWRDRLLSKGVQVTPVLDRQYFKSIYFRDPDGHILEIATNGPGFCVDEPEEHLGESLQLPPWMEHMRAEIQAELKPIQ